jgi:hypothetical protein
MRQEWVVACILERTLLISTVSEGPEIEDGLITQILITHP